MSQVVRRIIKSPKLPPALGPYSQAVQVGQTVYLSGKIFFLNLIKSIKSSKHRHHKLFKRIQKMKAKTKYFKNTDSVSWPFIFFSLI